MREISGDQIEERAIAFPVDESSSMFIADDLRCLNPAPAMSRAAS
jgi:hypothetical protein